ncbi:filamentous hemagglutinin N-terminal domain-containing protein [Trinickia fusca]|uniref:Filamentous hemagglutinin N-terminal domain-containing protein n=1 Tax=Trinickia fusca TaxID=2419777 RepID=A0A494X6E9_9BURK|nr:filamentous hemagglutinin N-terminal domain-containing protein [Trinickia fusca]RKP45892.1 filamentous hemagglutinin N-terminal domain-containing protein [Trinickia fusca]
MTSRIGTRCASLEGLRTAGAFFFLSAVCPTWAAAAGIVPDGGTATTVSIGANGRQVVSIAPAYGGVSQNTYSSFNVGSSGATLNNVGINARTIVNQVTSTNPSLIEGEIAVSGPRANVVLANPNGITVNGGSFFNTGRVALTTGQVSFNDLQIAPGIIQRNIALGTTGGTIVVGPQGLASALIGLDLIAKNVLINGAVNNGFTSPTAYVRTVAGTSQTTLNTGVSPGDNANDWLNVQTNAAPATASSFAVDISAAGSLTSGRIQLIVTDRGPGVRSAGAMNASLGDFTLASNGSVQFADSTISVAGNASLQAQDAITFSGSGLMAGGSVKLISNGLTLQTGVRGLGSTVASSTAGIVLKSTGDITNVGSLVQGQARTTGDTDSLGAVTLNATGNIANQSLPSTQLGVLFGMNDDVSVTAGGNLTNENSRILSNKNVSIVTSGDLVNLSDHTAGANGGTVSYYSNHGRHILFLSHHSNGFSVDYGQLVDPSKLAYISAGGDTGDVTIHANNVSNAGGSILSNGGSISITANQLLTTQATFTGEASYHQSCFILCHSSASSNVQSFGGVIEAKQDIALKAGTQITNTGGVVLATAGTLTLDAPKTLAQAVTGYNAFNRANDLKAWFGSTWAAIYAADTGGIFSAGSGQVHLTGEGDIDGGVISAPGGVNAAKGLITIRPRYTQPVTVGTHNHIGLVSWFGL